MKNIKPYFIGLLQTLGVSIYCLLVALFFLIMDKVNVEPPGMVGMALMLTLLVFSAAITGLMVFGYPAYLALNNKIKIALEVLAYTGICFVIVFLCALIVITNCATLGVA